MPGSKANMKLIADIAQQYVASTRLEQRSDYPTFQIIDSVHVFLNQIYRTIRKSHMIPLLDIALKATLPHWWRVHRNNVYDLGRIKRAMRERFKQTWDRL